MEFEFLKSVVKLVLESGALGLGWVAVVFLWRQNVKAQEACEKRYEEIIKEVNEVVKGNVAVLSELNARIQMLGR